MSQARICPDCDEIAFEATTCGTCFEHVCELCDATVRYDADGERICSACWSKLSTEVAKTFNDRVPPRAKDGTVSAIPGGDPSCDPTAGEGTPYDPVDQEKGAPASPLVRGGQGRTDEDVERTGVVVVVAVVLLALFVAGLVSLLFAVGR